MGRKVVVVGHRVRMMVVSWEVRDVMIQWRREMVSWMGNDASTRKNALSRVEAARHKLIR